MDQPRHGSIPRPHLPDVRPLDRFRSLKIKLGVLVVATNFLSVLVTWTLSVSEGVTAYRVERAAAVQPEAFEKVGEVSTPEFVDGGTPASVLKDSTKYLYRVVSVNRVEAESAPSAPAEVLTLPPPAQWTLPRNTTREGSRRTERSSSGLRG